MVITEALIAALYLYASDEDSRIIAIATSFTTVKLAGKGQQH